MRRVYVMPHRADRPQRRQKASYHESFECAGVSKRASLDGAPDLVETDLFTGEDGRSYVMRGVSTTDHVQDSDRFGLVRQYVTACQVCEHDRTHPLDNSEAACRGSDLDFFSDDAKVATKALSLCSECPIVSECLEFAIHNGYTQNDMGVWGGTTPAQRRALVRERA